MTDARAGSNEGAMRIARLDHLVLTVSDVDRTTRWYSRVLGMRPLTFGDGRKALAFGDQKLNLHSAGSELEPHAAQPTPGSADLCFLSNVCLDEVRHHLAEQRVVVELGPVERTGALGRLSSIYLRETDGNLVEISRYRA